VTVPTATTAAVDGRIESAVDGQVVGWAWRQGIDDPVEVEILVEGEAVSTVVADVRRKGLRRAGIGNGRHGFEVHLPAALATAGEHRLEVVVLPERVPLIAAAGYAGASESSDWNGTRFVPVESGPSAEEGDTPAPAALERQGDPAGPSPGQAPGLVESVADGYLAGWAKEGMRAIVKVDGRVVTKARAKVPRPDVEPGQSGFRAALPRELRGPDTHVLSVEIGDEPLLAGPHCQRPPTAPTGDWADADLRLAMLDHDAADLPRTVLGPGGWRFEERPAPRPLDDSALAEVAAAVRGWADAHSSLGIPYVFAVLPARERLERSHLPASLAVRGVSDAVSRLDRLLDGAAGPVTDLLEPLEAARSDRPVSHRTGSSLSAWGSFVAARALLESVAERVEGLEVPEPGMLQLTPVRGFRGDLAGRRAVMTEGDLRVELPLESVPAVALGERSELIGPGALSALRAPTPAHLIEAGEDRCAVYERQDAPGIRISIVGSNPPPAFVATVAEQVGRCLVLERPDPPLEAVELELPHAVIHLVDERGLPALAAGR
jgi:hypothetical protein